MTKKNKNEVKPYTSLYVGSRGSGKSTLMKQHIKENKQFKPSHTFIISPTIYLDDTLRKIAFPENIFTDYDDAIIDHILEIIQEERDAIFEKHYFRKVIDPKTGCIFPMYFVRLQCSCCPFDLRLLFRFHFSSRSNRLLRTQHISCSLLLLMLLLLRPPIERRTGTSQVWFLGPCFRRSFSSTSYFLPIRPTPSLHRRT